MSEIDTGLLPGEELRRRLEADGISPMPEEARLALLGIGELFATEAEVDDACVHVALQIVEQEEFERTKQGSDYEPPVFIVLLNGAVPAATRIFEEMSRYGHEIDPIYVNPSAYGGSQIPGQETKIKKDFTPEELIRMSGRRLIFFDDVHDTGQTIVDTIKYTQQALSGSLDTVSESGEIEEIELVTPTEQSMQFAFLWDKEPDPRLLHTAPDFVGATVPRKWITGEGCNTELPNGDSIGRFAKIGGISIIQPEDLAN